MVQTLTGPTSPIPVGGWSTAAERGGRPAPYEAKGSGKTRGVEPPKGKGRGGKDQGKGGPGGNPGKGGKKGKKGGGGGGAGSIGSAFGAASMLGGAAGFELVPYEPSPVTFFAEAISDFIAEPILPGFSWATLLLAFLLGLECMFGHCNF